MRATEPDLAIAAARAAMFGALEVVDRTAETNAMQPQRLRALANRVREYRDAIREDRP